MAGVRQTDIKPDNIMVDRNDDVHIIDAGSFVFKDNEASACTLKGHRRGGCRLRHGSRYTLPWTRDVDFGRYSEERASA